MQGYPELHERPIKLREKHYPSPEYIEDITRLREDILPREHKSISLSYRVMFFLL